MDTESPEPAPARDAGIILDETPEMARTRQLADRAAPTNINILIVGETGAGKEVLARYVHQRSRRAGHPFVALNCAGITSTLLESELFGHERGAFTGAVAAKPGLLETGRGGTVFLDEIGEMPLAMQAKLLHVLERREVLPVGALKPRPIDVRFMAATNRDLEAEIAAGRFRADLFFRLNGISLGITPLRRRQAAILPLARAFLAEASARGGRPCPRLGAAAVRRLVDHDWPGNVRELKNVMERAAVLCDAEIGPEHLMLATAAPLAGMVAPGDVHDGPADCERDRIWQALEAWAGNQTRAARSLGIPRRTFVSKLDRYGFPRPRKLPTLAAAR